MSRWHSAREICAKLGGRWAGRSGMCRCPAHEDRSPSLSVSETRDGRVLVYCFAGCSQRDVIEALKARGLWGDGETVADPSYPGRLTSRHDGMRSRDDRERRRAAQDIWDAAKPAAGTLVERYLRGRGVRMRMPDQLRFLGACKHGPSKQSFPVMVARIADNRGFCSIQRTWLTPDGSGKAPIKPAKMTLGPMERGAVRLFPVGERLGIAEGIETAFSAAQIYSVPVWATLSANRLAKIDLPESVRVVVIFADNGEVGRREAWAAADEYERRGLHCEIITPDAHFAMLKAGDFNDIFTAKEETA